jgi:hypothetical protein
MKELHCYDYVNHPYEAARAAVLADPQALFQRATSSGANPELHARVGALELGAEIEISIRAIDEPRSPFAHPATNLVLEWKATHNPGLFPIMQATLSVYPLTPTETQLDLSGIYDPPLGFLGDLVDAAALHRYAEASVQRLVRDLATCLRRELSSVPAKSA